VDSAVAGEETIAFNAGTHRDVVLMRFKDYQNLVKPEIVHFAQTPAA
jgi:Ala-tRNA(Pro) deacylase